MALNLSRGKPMKYYSSNRIASLVANGIMTFIDKRTNTISTSTIFKVIQRDKLLKPLELKPYDQTEKTIIRIQNFVDDFIKTNNREPTVGEVKIGAKTDPKQLTQYKNKGLITGIQDTVFDAHKIAINYLNNTKNSTKPTVLPG